MINYEQNVAIAKAIGLKPRRLWQFSYESTNEHRSVGYFTKEEAERNRDNQIHHWCNDLYGPCTIGEVEEYDDWYWIDKYDEDLNAMKKVEDWLSIQINRDGGSYLPWYFHNLEQICSRNPILASAKQRRDAFLKTLGL
jgi:hypothetical protein